jgi:FkbM family methyltransferase
MGNRLTSEWTRRLARWGMRLWARSGRAYGWFYRAMETYGPRLGAGAVLPRRLHTGQTVRCDLRDHVQRQLYFQGVYEPVEAYLFSRLATPGMTVVDAGANVGQYTLIASARVGRSGAVHSFEPVPETYRVLAEHVAANRAANVVANRAALWHEPAELTLGQEPGDEVNSGSFAVGAAGGRVTSPAVRFDDYARESVRGPVGLVKMDIEGAELFALRGMAGVLARDRPAILMEVNREACARLGYDPTDLWKLLVGDLGYAAWRIGHSAAEWAPIPVGDGLVRENVLFVSGVLPESVRRGWTLRGILRWAGATRTRPGAGPG